MTEPRSGWPDDRVERAIGNLLRAGVMLSALVVIIGALFFLKRHGADPVKDRTVFEAEVVEFRTPAGVFRAAWHFRSGGLIQLGLLLLIATPVARVIFSIVAFALQRDRTYILITLFVLIILLYSLFSGHLV